MNTHEVNDAVTVRSTLNLRLIMGRGISLIWQSGSGILVYALLFGLLSAGVLLPPLFELLHVLGRYEGNGIVGNYTVLPWILSGRGALWGILLLSSSVILLILFLAGLFLLFALRRETKVLRRIFLHELWIRLPEIIGVSVRWSLLVLAAVLFLGLVPGLGFLIFLREHDINYYLKSQPVEWWAVLGCSAVWVGAVGFILLRVLLRISLLFPLWVRRPSGIRQAARESWSLTRGHERRLFMLLIIPGVSALIIHLALGLAIFTLMESLLPWFAETMRGILTVIAGSILLFVLESFALLCAGVALICALWSLLCEERCPSPVKHDAGTIAHRGTDTRIIRSLVLAGTCAALIIYIFYSVVQVPIEEHTKRTLVVAHRGGAAEAPENSLDSFRLALTNGFSDMIEMDVAMTSDSVIILAHDSDLMRQAGDPRKLADIRWDDMSAISLTTPLSRGLHVAPVARLEDALTTIGTQCPMIIEFKHSKRTPELVPRTVTVVKEFGLMTNVVFMSLDYDDILAVQSLAPEALVGYFVSVEMGDFLNLDIDAIAPRHTLVTRAVMKKARNRGLPVFAWTVDDPARILELLDLGVDAIITNEPNRTRKVVDAYFMIPLEVRSLLRFKRLWGFLLDHQGIRIDYL